MPAELYENTSHAGEYRRGDGPIRKSNPAIYEWIRLKRRNIWSLFSAWRRTVLFCNTLVLNSSRTMEQANVAL